MNSKMLIALLLGGMNLSCITNGMFKLEKQSIPSDPSYKQYSYDKSGWGLFHISYSPQDKYIGIGFDLGPTDKYKERYINLVYNLKTNGKTYTGDAQFWKQSPKGYGEYFLVDDSTKSLLLEVANEFMQSDNFKK